MRELIIKWLHEGMAMSTGEELYVPADSQPNQKDLYFLFRKELSTLRAIEAVEASKLRIFPTYKDKQFWVVIKKISVTPLVAFKKGTDGKVERVVIENTKEQDRINKLRGGSNG